MRRTRNDSLTVMFDGTGDTVGSHAILVLLHGIRIMGVWLWYLLLMRASWVRRGGRGWGRDDSLILLASHEEENEGADEGEA